MTGPFFCFCLLCLMTVEARKHCILGVSVIKPILFEFFFTAHLETRSRFILKWPRSVLPQINSCLSLAFLKRANE